MRQKLLSLCLVVATLSPCLAEAQAVVRRVPNPGDPDLVDYRIFIRARGELLHNLDLDRGPTPSGDPLFPVPQAGMCRRFRNRFSLPPAVRRDCSRLEHSFYYFSAQVLLHAM